MLTAHNVRLSNLVISSWFCMQWNDL